MQVERLAALVLVLSATCVLAMAESGFLVDPCQSFCLDRNDNIVQERSADACCKRHGFEKGLCARGWLSQLDRAVCQGGPNGGNGSDIWDISTLTIF